MSRKPKTLAEITATMRRNFELGLQTFAGLTRAEAAAYDRATLTRVERAELRGYRGRR